MKLKNDESKILPMMTVKWKVRFLDVTNMKYGRHIRPPLKLFAGTKKFSFRHSQCNDYEEHNSLSRLVRHRETEICCSY